MRHLPGRRNAGDSQVNDCCHTSRSIPYCAIPLPPLPPHVASHRLVTPPSGPPPPTACQRTTHGHHHPPHLTSTSHRLTPSLPPFRSPYSYRRSLHAFPILVFITVFTNTLLILWKGATSIHAIDTLSRECLNRGSRVGMQTITLRGSISIYEMR